MRRHLIPPDGQAEALLAGDAVRDVVVSLRIHGYRQSVVGPRFWDRLQGTRRQVTGWTPPGCSRERSEVPPWPCPGCARGSVAGGGRGR